METNPFPIFDIPQGSNFIHCQPCVKKSIRRPQRFDRSSKHSKLNLHRSLMALLRSLETNHAKERRQCEDSDKSKEPCVDHQLLSVILQFWNRSDAMYHSIPIKPIGLDVLCVEANCMQDSFHSIDHTRWSRDVVPSLALDKVGEQSLECLLGQATLGSSCHILHVQPGVRLRPGIQFLSERKILGAILVDQLDLRIDAGVDQLGILRSLIS